MMSGEFITRGLILVLGYAYPAFECFKTMEKNTVETHEIRFWCQYWIIVAVLTVLERIVDLFISWLPLYGELKLMLIIYLWCPKTSGTGYVYENLLRPCVSMREADIDRGLRRAWVLALYYWRNCTSLGETKFFEILEFITGQFRQIMKSNNETADEHLQKLADQHLPKLANKLQHKNEGHHNHITAAPPPSPPTSPSSSLFTCGRHPTLPPSGTVYRCVAQPSKSDVVLVFLPNQTEYVHTLTREEPDPTDYSSGLGRGSGSTSKLDSVVVHHRVDGTKAKFCRGKMKEKSE